MPAIADSKCGNPLSLWKNLSGTTSESTLNGNDCLLLSDQRSNLVAGEGLEPPTSGL